MRLVKQTTQLLRLPVSSIRSRLIIFLLLLMLPVLAGIYWFVSQENQRYTDETINSYLAIGTQVFEFSRTEHINTLLTVSSALTRDWGFRNAFGAADQATILDAAENLLMRSFEAADVMLISDMQGRVIVDTADQGFEQLSGSWQALMDRAASSNDGVAEAVLTIAQKPYQVTVIPLFLPAPVAWIFAGFPLDDKFVQNIKRTTASDVSVLRYSGDIESPVTGTVIASTLSGRDADLTLSQLDPTQIRDTQRIRLQDAEYGTLLRPLSADTDQGELILAVIQRSYRENEANLAQLRDRLFQFSLAVVCLSLVAVIILARSFTRPIVILADRVKMIEQGDYKAGAARRSASGANDELAQLDSSVTAMAKGLAERENMRDLLGKVVSPQIAAELLASQIELGGEERVVTVLFADIRGFTALSEQQTPSQTLHMLNLCFEQICTAIEDSGGVVDKFTGDAVMALFGAPVMHADDAVRAGQAIAAIEAALERLKDDPRLPAAGLSIGLGIHTGLVVAGNMGSQNRMNYTVIGDAVNLAARLESLTRVYGVSNLISEEFVAAMGDSANDFDIQELDLVRVKGKRETSRLLTMIGPAASAPAGNRLTAPATGQPRSPSADADGSRARFDQMLNCYRNGQWEQALDILRALESEDSGALPSGLYRMYQHRILELRANPPANWDGVFDFAQK
ncbi:MAG: adenylate/guanylate cyclase domain-containing protein [Pseudohongiella sp.]|nr:adenylate/guanylate cyclase domain-containing protein [Pseudohongiella sp.]